MSYQEEMVRLLGMRSKALSKAGSVTHTIPEDKREHVRAAWEASAEGLHGAIIDLVVATYPDKRPAPLPEVFYNEKRMVIQRYDGVTCWYVSEDKYDPTKYEYKVTDYRTHIQQQLDRH